VRALVELPIFRDGREAWPMYHSTLHWKPIANGFSGYEAQSHADLAQSIQGLPEAPGFARLRQLGISHLLVRGRSQRRAKLLARWEREYGPQGKGWMEPVYEERAIRVYRLTAPSEGASSSSNPNRSGL